MPYAIGFLLILGAFLTSAAVSAKRKMRNAAAAGPTGAKIADAYLARAGHEDRATELPAWALMMRSPFGEQDWATSWIGGLPKAPENFDWPAAPDGQRMHFLAQIDLSALKAAPNTGLPDNGALLVFFTYQWDENGPAHRYACEILSVEELQHAVEVPAPDDLAPLNQHMGFFNDTQTFTKRGVDLVPFVSDGSNPPKGIRYDMDKPERWITTWGVAALEAEDAVRVLRPAVDRWIGKRGEFHLAEARDKVSSIPGVGYYADEVATGEGLREHGPQMLEQLEDWLETARAHRPEDPVDPVALAKIFAARDAFAKPLPHLYPQSQFRFGLYPHVWRSIFHRLPQIVAAPQDDPERRTFEQFIDAYATGWRGHRLFGIEPPFDNNSEDLRGQDCLISIASDDLLDLQSEHEYGLSIWCPRERMAAGDLTGGQVVRHCAV